MASNLTYDSHGGLVANGNFGTTISVDYPTTQEGDLMVLAVQILSNQTITNPSGWTLVNKVSNANISYGVYLKEATGSESGSLSVTVASSSNSDNKAGIIFRYTGGWNSADTSGLSHTLPTTLDITENLGTFSDDTGGAKAIFICGQDSGTSIFTSGSIGPTERAQENDLTYNATFVLMDEEVAYFGTSGDADFDGSSGDYSWACATYVWGDESQGSGRRIFIT